MYAACVINSSASGQQVIELSKHVGILHCSVTTKYLSVKTGISGQHSH